MLSKEEVIKIANLARLELTDSEVEKMQKDLAEILNYIDQLNTVDPVRGREGSQRASASNGVDTSSLENTLRDDVPIPQTPETIEKMLSQAPATDGHHIKVHPAPWSL